MSVYFGQIIVLNYATTQLEATHVLVTVATQLIWTSIDVMVSTNSMLYKLCY